MFIFLKTLHIVALMFGSLASLGNVYLLLARGPHDLDAPGYTNLLRKLYRLTALGAIGVLWVSGLLMSIAGPIWESGTAFKLKLLLAALLLVIITILNLMAPGWARRGGPPAWITGVHIVAAVILLCTAALGIAAFS
ncbi:MAG: hypothetical protein WBO55_11320 [Rhizobiaceae bacterium]